MSTLVEAEAARSATGSCGHRIAAGAHYLWDEGEAVSYCSPGCARRYMAKEVDGDGVQFLLDGLGVDSIKTLHELVERGRQDKTSDTILRWAEHGFPPWGCHHCRGAEYGPDGVACPACGGDSTSIEPPERAAAFYEKMRPSPFPDDAGMQLAYDCLRDRHGIDADELRERMEEYGGDFWFDFFGPLLDRIEQALDIETE